MEFTPAVGRLRGSSGRSDRTTSIGGGVFGIAITTTTTTTSISISISTQRQKGLARFRSVKCIQFDHDIILHDLSADRYPKKAIYSRPIIFVLLAVAHLSVSNSLQLALRLAYFITPTIKNVDVIIKYGT